MNEIWKSIPIEGLDIYEVSNQGRVKNAVKVMKSIVGTNGYFKISLVNESTRKRNTYSVHRLVALAFHEQVEGNTVVNHIDGDKLNNRSDNLEWVTQSQNIKHSYDNGLHVVSVEQLERLRGFAMKRSKRVRVTNHHLGLDQVFESVREAGRAVQCNEKTIRNILKGRYKSRLGYEACYIGADVSV